jgi:hypothetical protein
MEGFKYNSNDP